MVTSQGQFPGTNLGSFFFFDFQASSALGTSWQTTFLGHTRSGSGTSIFSLLMGGAIVGLTGSVQGQSEGSIIGNLLGGTL